jgi:hypothetical protein
MSKEDRDAMLARLGPPYMDPVKIALALTAPLKRFIKSQKVANPHARVEAARQTSEAIRAIRSTSAKRAWKTSPLLKAKRRK